MSIQKNTLLVLDLDAALERVAQKLRPVALGDCGTTVLPSDSINTNGQGICGCTCCGYDSPTTLSDIECCT